MALRPGEKNVATLFADVHYFYGPPTDKPPHHRFDKGSYVYLFENAGEHRARIEVANQPGTEHQDAFDGYLDTARLEYSYKRTCVVTLTVGPVHGTAEWHLPTYDPHNQNKYHYKLHAVDLYFWTQHDALAFVDGIRRVLPPARCTITDEPGPPPRRSADVSAVVQRLETAAIADDSPRQQQQPAAAFVPMAYNPAAPAAPEPVCAREKTPPPPDGAVNPLQQTLAQDAAMPLSPHAHAHAHHGHPGLVRAATVPVAVPDQGGGMPSPALASPSVYGPGGYGGGGGVAQPLGEYGLHSQFYVPEGGEPLQYKPKTETRGKLEENAARLERGVTGILKKFEKRFG